MCSPDADGFLAAAQSSQKLQRYGLTSRPLEAARSVRVEALPPAVGTGRSGQWAAASWRSVLLLLNVSVCGSSPEMLELHFEKHWVLPEKITMIPQEEAALVTFRDPKGQSSLVTRSVTSGQMLRPA